MNREFGKGMILGGFIVFAVISILIGVLPDETLIDILNIRSIDGVRYVAPPSLIQEQDVYTAAADWTLLSPEGYEKRFGDFSGKIVFLYLWSVSFPPPEKELRSIQRLFDSLKTSGVEFVLASATHRLQQEKWRKQHPYMFPLYAYVEDLPGAFAVEVIPSAFVIGRSGEVRFLQIGSAEWDAPWLIGFLRKLAAKEL